MPPQRKIRRRVIYLAFTVVIWTLSFVAVTSWWSSSLKRNSKRKLLGYIHKIRARFVLKLIWVDVFTGHKPGYFAHKTTCGSEWSSAARFFTGREDIFQTTAKFRRFIHVGHFPEMGGYGDPAIDSLIDWPPQLDYRDLNSHYAPNTRPARFLGAHPAGH